MQGCFDSGETDYERQVREDDEAITAYLEANDIEAEKASSGVYVEKLTENAQGKQVVEDHVVGILYTMTHLTGGHEIESHTDILAPLRFSNSFDLNLNAIHPAGLNYEIGGMREGEKFRFYIPSVQAYENYSHDELFDSYSNFILEVDLVEVKTEEEIYEEEMDTIEAYLELNEPDAESYPNGLYYVLKEEGSGDQPNINSQVKFHYTRKYLDGTVIQSTLDGDPEQVHLNDNQLVTGFKNGILLMEEGEKAKLIMPSKLAFGKSVQVIPQALREQLAEDGEIVQTKPYSPVIYEVELLEIN
ncbi:MAG: FKBP-type peptidyl-prolyl cis-trans isomerase [Balneolales bacterium]